MPDYIWQLWPAVVNQLNKCLILMLGDFGLSMGAFYYTLTLIFIAIENTTHQMNYDTQYVLK